MIVSVWFPVLRITICIEISSRLSILAQRSIFLTQQIVKSPEQLIEWLQQNEITILHLTPALGQLLLTAGRRESYQSIRWVLFGGDVLTTRDVTNSPDSLRMQRSANFYGATETQRAVGYYEVPDEFHQRDEANHAVPLGRGIKDVQLLLLTQERAVSGNW